MPWIKQHTLFSSFIVFVCLNILLYAIIYFFHGAILFNAQNYTDNFHHYIQDPRIEHKPFSFLDALAQSDAQWYLRIADKGYPLHPTNTNIKDREVLDGLSYAFFPLYPLVLSIFHLIIPNLMLAAFVFANVLLIVNFFSLYKVVTCFYSKRIAIKTTFLLFLFPFSIFYRSYYTEGLFLSLLLWSVYFFVHKKYLVASLLLGLLLITRGNGVLLVVFFVSYLIKITIKRALAWKKLLFALFLLAIPMTIWMLYCFHQTGSFFYFVFVHGYWFTLGVYTPLTILYNLWVILHFFTLPIHSFHFSQVEVAMVVSMGILLLLSFRKLPRFLWLIAFSLWIFPLLVTDMQSFSRYQSVSFPIFIYLSTILGKWYYYVLLVFAILLYIIAIAFVNWYWIG